MPKPAAVAGACLDFDPNREGASRPAVWTGGGADHQDRRIAADRARRPAVAPQRQGRPTPSPGDPSHGHSHPSRRRDAAGAEALHARPAARARHVRRRHRRAADHREGAAAPARGRRLPDLRRPVLLRRRVDPAVARLHPLVRRAHAGDDGRDLRLGRADGVDRAHPSRRRGGADDLRLDHRRRRHRRADRADRQPDAAVLPAGGHRHDHPGDRHHADAGRHQLDLRDAGRTDRAASRQSRACGLARAGDRPRRDGAAAAGRLRAGADAGQPRLRADLEHHPVDDRARRRHGHRPLRQGLPRPTSPCSSGSSPAA